MLRGGASKRPHPCAAMDLEAMGGLSRGGGRPRGDAAELRPRDHAGAVTSETGSTRAGVRQRSRCADSDPIDIARSCTCQCDRQLHSATRPRCAEFSGLQHRRAPVRNFLQSAGAAPRSVISRCIGAAIDDPSTARRGGLSAYRWDVSVDNAAAHLLAGFRTGGRAMATV